MARKSFIEKLLKQDNINIEFYKEFDLISTLQTICAFLNSDGGWVLIGYFSGKTFGIGNNPETIINSLEDAVMTSISPQALVYISKEKYESKNLVLVNVLKGPNQPYTYNSEYYIRDNDSSIKASTDEISLLLRTSTSKLSYWEKINVIDADFSDLDEDEIHLTMIDANEKGRDKGLPNSAQEFLSYFNLLNYSQVSNAAMLLFGEKPIKFIPQCRVIITVMPFGKSGGNYSDEYLIEYNLFTSLELTIDYFKRTLPLISEFDSDTGNRITKNKYPTNAIREALVNAIVHRDYSDFSGDITINIYNDYIEIINSGEMPPNIVSKKSEILPHHSIFRNPSIGHMFYLRGKMEKKGRGLSLIKNEFIDLGYRSPEWISENGYTTLKLFAVTEELNDRMKQYLTKLRKGEVFTKQAYMNYFSNDISDRTARGDISSLVKSKYLIVEGSGPSTKYKRTNRELPDSAR